MDKLKSTKAQVGAAIAVVGTGITTTIALISQDSPLFIPLTVLGAMLVTAGTYFGVYSTTNEPVE